MKKTTLLFFAMFAFFLQANAQSIINITTSEGSYTSEKWVSITDGVDGTGTQIWGQGNGTQCDGAGLINENISLPAGTYYVNCYDKYDDSWDGTLISVTAYGSVIGDNGGVSPDDGEDTDASYLCEGTPEELEASFMIVVPVAPCVAPTVTFTVIEDCALGFTVDIDVTDMGDATSYDVQESGASVGTITATGVTNVGPFTNDNAIDLTLVHNVSTLCNLEETGLVNSACPATNDECANAIDLDSVMNVDETTCTLTYVGSNVGATNSAGEIQPSSSCTNATSDPNPSDIWFTLTVPASGGFIYDDIVTPGYSSIVEVYTGSCGALTPLDPVVCNSSLSEKTFDGLTPGTTVYLRYWDYGSNEEGVLEFCIKPTPSCPVPSGLTASNIAETTADLTWTEEGSATTWNIEWGTAPLTQGAGTMVMGTTTNPHALTGLTADTEYEYYVQADCGGGDTSAWAGPFSFTTTTAPPECGGNFYDTGGSASSYSNNENYTITICPDASGDAVSVAFTSFLVEGRAEDTCWDSLFIYDGADETATPITPASLGLGAGTEGFCWQGVNDGTADLTGEVITSSDASGCLTFTFTSDGTTQLAGWEAMIGCEPLSVQDIAFNDLFSYFPNPVNNNLTLTAQKDIENIAVYNMLGQEVLRTAPNAVNTEVNMSALQAGAYFVKVTIGNATETVKVIKK